MHSAPLLSHPLRAISCSAVFSILISNLSINPFHSGTDLRSLSDRSVCFDAAVLSGVLTRSVSCDQTVVAGQRFHVSCDYCVAPCGSAMLSHILCITFLDFYSAPPAASYLCWTLVHYPTYSPLSLIAAPCNVFERYLFRCMLSHSDYQCD